MTADQPHKTDHGRNIGRTDDDPPDTTRYTKSTEDLGTPTPDRRSVPPQLEVHGGAGFATSWKASQHRSNSASAASAASWARSQSALHRSNR